MSWPTWLSKTLPAWLEQTGYPFNGVGDLEDLEFSTQLTQVDKWLGFVNPGWFYYDNKEDYKYINKGTQTATTSTTATLTAVTSYRPSWGPVLVSGSLYGPYVQHHNIYEPGIQVTWTQIVSTQVFYYDLPSNQYCVGLRDLNNTKFGRVNSLTYPLVESLYFYDETLNRVYVLSPITAPDTKIFIDVLNDVPKLKFYEALTVDKDLKVRLTYLRPYGMNNIVIKRGTSSITPSSGYPSVVNEFDVSSLSVKEGDWVVAEYYINNSFILTAHNSLTYYSNTLGAETLTVNFETSVPTTLKQVEVANSITGTDLNFNPSSIDGFRSGYLIYTDTVPTWTTSSIKVESDKSIFNTPETLVKFKITLLDQNGLPIPNKTITTVNVNGATIVQRYPATNKTDNKGELNLLLSKSSSITVSVTDNSITTSKTVTYLTIQSALSQVSTQTLKKAFCFHSNQFSGDKKLINFAATQIDGRPYFGDLTFAPKSSTFFKWQDSYFSKEQVFNNAGSVSYPGGFTLLETSESFDYLVKSSFSQSTLGSL